MGEVRIGQVDFELVMPSAIALTSGLELTASLEVPTDVDLALWIRALAAASTGKELPTEYAFLRDARMASIVADDRRSVLDAATAAEIAMTKLMDAKVGRKPAKSLSRAKGPNIARLAAALRGHRIPIPKDTQGSGLADPRNDAIHTGQPPRLEQAERAIAIAAEIVALATPLDSIW